MSINIFAPSFDKNFLQTVNIQSLYLNNPVIIKYNNMNYVNFNDNIWDISILTPNALIKSDTIIDFNMLDNPNKLYEKHLVLLMMKKAKSPNGKSLNYYNFSSTYFKEGIVLSSNYAYERGISYVELFKSEKLTTRYFHYLLKTKPSHTDFTSKMINLFKSIGSKKLTFRIPNHQRSINLAREYKKEAEKLHKQTLMIPTGIYIKLLQQLWNQFEMVELYIDDICKFIENNIHNRINGTYVDHLYVQKTEKEARENLYDIGLDRLCKKFNKNISSASIHSILTSLKGIIEMIIAAYSGMRKSEIASLKTGCFTVANNISKITGYTTKFSDKGIPLQVDWITSPKIKRAINALEKITKSISIARNIPHKDMHLMFNSFLVSKYGNISDDTWKYPRSSGMPCNSKYNTLIPLDIRINKEDIEELSVFTPSRDIDNEFKINDNWDIKLHQFRRTLIINALSSRLVSVGGLQRQLKHTTKEMTMYYGKGSSNADLHFDKNDFAIEFKKAMPQIEALNYIYDVLFSTESLYGEMGKQVEDSKVKNIDDYKSYYLENRTITEKEIKEGRLKYSQTALGGCTSLTECDKKLTFSVTSCFDCKSVIWKESKINKVIEKTKWFLSTLNQNTPEYRSTKEDLNSLIEAKRKVIS